MKDSNSTPGRCSISCALPLSKSGRGYRIIFVLLTAMFLGGSIADCRAGNSAFPQEVVECRFAPEDTIAYHRAMETLLPFAGLPKGELMVRVAEHFYGTPYVAGTLEGSSEVLTVRLCQTDCILFVEMCVAIVTLLQERDGRIPPFGEYCSLIQSMRYRNGKVDGYASRLHYTSEWILQNSASGRMQEVTEAIGGRPLQQEFSFMTANSGKYPALAEDTAAVRKIREVEQRLNVATEYFSIPASEIREDLIRDGDIVCFVSGTAGLDITHVGIAARDEDGSLHFIHASLREKKVVFEPRTLREYCRTSIRIVRLLPQEL